MKGKQCFGLLSLLSIMLGLSLSVSSDTFALKHDYDNLFIPSYVYYFSDGNGVYSSFSTNQYYSNYYPSSNALSHPSLSSQNLLCNNSSYSSLFSASGGSLFGSYSTFHFNVGLNFDSTTNCFREDSSSWYSYSGLQISRSSDGYSTPASISDIFGSDSQTMYVFSLPLTLNVDNIGPLSLNRSLHFHGEFSSTSDFVYSNRVYPEISVSGILSDYSSSSTFSYSWRDASSNSDTNYCNSLVPSVTGKSLVFDCFISLPVSFSKYTTFGITFHPSSWYSSPSSPEVEPLWTNSSPVFLENFYVITDNDDTPGPSASYPLSGSDIYSSPTANSTSGTSWFDSLVNLFQFNLLNPFSGLFAMFTASSHCVNIPIIAGMLNSTETQYCSWFPPSVRSVLTPVFGVSSVMLLFGFFVRWLGSSSGNMFEDQTSHKWGNTQIKKGGK